MTRPIISNQYVLTHIAPDNGRTMLGLIKKRLGRVELDFNKVDFGELRAAIQSLTSQSHELSHRVSDLECEDAQSEAGACGPMRVSTDQSLSLQFFTDIAEGATHYVSLEAFKQAAEEVVRVKQAEDSGLDKAFQNLLRVCDTKEESGTELIEYYALFFPAQDDLAARPASAIRNIFEAITEMLKKLLKVFKIGASLVWDVLKNPDEAYLRFRGEIRELELRHPEYKWLKYVLLAPDLFRLYVRLMFDPDVAWPVKAKVLGVLAYFVSPFDLLPEGLIGPIGYIDDVFLMVMAIIEMTNGHQIHPRKLEEHWAGDREMLAWVVDVSQKLDEKLDFFQHLRSGFRGMQEDTCFVA